MNDGVPGLHTPGEDIAVLISDGVPPLRGIHRYRYGIYPHGGDWREARVPWRAWGVSSNRWGRSRWETGACRCRSRVRTSRRPAERLSSPASIFHEESRDSLL